MTFLKAARISTTVLGGCLATALGVAAISAGNADYAMQSFWISVFLGVLWLPSLRSMAARRVGMALSPYGWSRPEQIKDQVAPHSLDIPARTALPSNQAMDLLPTATASVKWHRRRGSPEEDIAIRDENRRGLLLMAARDLDRDSGNRDIRSAFMRLQSHTRHGELEIELERLLKTATAWLSLKHHLDTGTRAEGQHILSILAEHCVRMIENEALLNSDEACERLAASLRAREPQLQASVDALVDENGGRLLATLGALSDRLGNLQRRLEDGAR
jgi:hypothetical protein